MAERFVIDASVVAKWFLQDDLESQVDLAEEVLIDALGGRVELHAPRLMSYDVCRLVWKACITPSIDKKAKRLDKDTATSCVATLFDLPLAFGEATAQEAIGSVDRGVRYRKNFYDMT